MSEKHCLKVAASPKSEPETLPYLGRGNHRSTCVLLSSSVTFSLLVFILGLRLFSTGKQVSNRVELEIEWKISADATRHQNRQILTKALEVGWILTD